MTKKQLYELYITNNNSQAEISRIAGVSVTTVRRWLNKFGIPRRKMSDCIKNKLDVDLDTLEKATILYNKGLNRGQIALELGVTEHHVRKALAGKFLGYKDRSKFVVTRKAHPLTEAKLQCFLGTLLGDASLIRRRGSYQYAVSHCAQQKDLVDHVARIVGSNVYTINPSKGRYSQKVYYKTSYENKGCLEQVYNIVSRDNRKHINTDWVSRIDPEAIAHWYMDDGSSTFMGGGFVRVSFSTLSFGVEELELLVEMLDSFSIKSAHHKHSKPNKNGVGRTVDLSVNRENTIRFMDLIKPYIIPCMAYKIKYPTYPNI